MSMSGDAPAGAAGTEPTHEPEGGAPIAGQVDGSTGAQGAGDASSQDYLGRIRVDPDFAAEEVRKHQSRADRMEAENRKLAESAGVDIGPIKGVLEQGVTPDVVKTVFDNYLRMRNDPATHEMIVNFEQTGVLQPQNGSTTVDDDEYLTDEQREINTLKAELQQVRQETAGLAQSTGSAALQGHLEQFAKDNFLTESEFDAVKKGMLAQAQQWSGNEAGLKLLRDLQRPEAYETVDAVAWKYVPKQVRLELGERKRLHDQGRVERHRTDGPSGVSTTGREPPPEFKSTADALRYAKANPDRI